MRVVPCVLLLMSCLSVAGCNTFGKKGAANSAGPAPAAPTTSSPAPPLYPPAPRGTGLGPPVSGNPPPGVNGFLAGRVLDSANRRLLTPTVQIVEMTETGKPGGAPIEVPVDSQGYFTIPGLQTGRRYQLTARARSGQQALTGTAWATPPDPKVVIRLNETIAAPPPPVAVPNAPPPSWPTPGDARSDAADQGWVPGRGGPPAANPKRAAELGPPRGLSPVPHPEPPSPAPSTPSLQNIAGDHNDKLAQGIGCQVPGPGKTPTRAAPAWAPSFDPGPARVPSCVLTGQTLHNFALNDLGGRPWEFRNHTGRLVLLDFWGSWCIPCLHSIPHLNILQERYGPYGLEVVGIAYESGTPQEQYRKVNDVRQRLRMNYRILLGSDRATCPVRTQFAVNHWPTLVLLDEKGRIVWRSEGLDAAHVRELDIIIRQRLGLR